MSSILVPPAGTDWPDHMQLPETDGKIVENFQEHPQGALLKDSLASVLQRLHPDNRYIIGLDSGIYWRYVAEEPLRGCKSPDWYYVPGVSPMLGGAYRRSYVLWQEHEPPQIVLEFVSGDGSEERDSTPETGKFWVYEQAIRAAYYGIFDAERLLLEVYERVQGRYQRMAPNANSRFFIPPLGVELGIWHGDYSTMTLPWLRWWDTHGNLLPTSSETAELLRRQMEQERQAKARAERQALEDRQAKEQAERQAQGERQARERAERQAEQARQETEAAVERAKRLMEKLRGLGIDPGA